MKYKTCPLVDRSQILTYLETDRLYAAYAIGDLEPGMFEQSVWAGAEKACPFDRRTRSPLRAGSERRREGRLQALALLFRGLEPPVLFLMGDVCGLREILNELCPEQAYLNCRVEHLAMTCDFYAWQETTPMWRMALHLERFRPAAGDCIRLTADHAAQLAALYALGGGTAFHPAQVERGVFYGITLDGQLVSAAGTHLVSPTYGVAALGNVFTHPDCRGRGYATATTSAVVAELLRRGMGDIILNVGQQNTGAIRIYERLGFERYCPFLEGPALARAIRKEPPR